MKQFFFFGWLCLLVFSCTVAQQGHQLKADETREINGTTYFVHRVKKQQTLYSIARAYEVDMQAIIDRNPEIRNGLKTGQTLLIPAGRTPSPSRQLPPPPAVPKPVLPDTSALPLPEIQPCSPDPDAMGKTYTIAFLQHFFLSEPGYISATTPTPEEIASYKPFRYIQFYEGFLLAVDSLRKRGANLNIHVYDVEPSVAGTERLLKRPEMKEMDLIIGMVYHQPFQVLADWARKHRIPLVSPVSERESQVEGNPMVIKVRPPNSTEPVDLASYLSEHHAWDHLLVVRGPEADAAGLTTQLINGCKGAGLDIKHVSEGQLVPNLVTGIRNVVVVVTTQKSFALNVLARLNATEKPYEISLFGLPRWDEFNGMDYELMKKSNAHVMAPFWLDSGKPATGRFTELFTQHYYTFPEPLAYEGFDIGLFFLEALFTRGRNFIGCLPELTRRPIMTTFGFCRPDNESGWENHHWVILRFENYSFEPVN